ncbi:MAG: hypothetical protein FDZ75_08830 [Actinobacteria bacterium]|nr:MAG: hypothetical protein FDZ75_08830 [Actinomycetota bacterium]
MSARLRAVAPVVAGWTLAALALVAAWRAFEPVRVTGLSMHPALHVGDLVIARRGVVARKGEIALIRAPGHGPVLHRVVAVRAGRLETRGDANHLSDAEATDPGQTTRVVLVLPVGRAAEWWRARVPCATLTAQSDSVRR